jgi:DNA-directed RNA polymerase specialized sigma24 family protein
MDGPAITKFEIDWLILEAINGNEEALDLLMRSQWMFELLYRISDWARRKKNIEADVHGTDIQEIVAARIREKLHTIKNPKNTAWRTCLRNWSYRVAARCCESVRTGKHVEEDYRLAIEHENTDRIEHGVRRIEPSSHTPSQDEELERKEQAPLRDKLELVIHEKALKAFDASTPEGKRILSLWMEGMTLKQISEAMGIPLATAHRMLKKLQRAIVAEVGKGIVEEIGETRAEESGVVKVLQDVVEDRDDLHELLANGSQETQGRGHPAHTGV